MELRDVAALRLRNQHVSGAPLEAPQQVVAWLGAMQSQEYAAAKWSIGQRTGGASDAVVDAALADGSILRTHVLRPTWHFVAPEDIRWMMELTGPRVAATNAYWYRKFGLDEALFDKSNALLRDTLAGGNHLTRKQIASLFDEHGAPAEGLQLGYLLMRAELDLLICSGAPKGKQRTYALLEERAPQATSLPRDEALAELTKRYFTSRGPATVKDYVAWSGLTVADAKRGLEMVEPPLQQVVAGDWTCWFAAASPQRPPVSPPPASPTAHLLQGYDEYVMGYGESRGVLDVAGLARIVPGGGPMFTHAVILDGQVVGHWRRVPKPKTVAVEVQLAMPLAGAQSAALDDAVARYGRFVGLPATWF
ncbi:MAG: winged helix DNA-binding domain-containing protein [Actinomycetota bacterium]|nr:winged helix DNA-binding domain-containing protein [Actinomycetota bacterium]MDQ3591972.1 winged helix DNA-binding domain-containing protein [Actinomycetota bacterium]